MLRVECVPRALAASRQDKKTFPLFRWPFRSSPRSSILSRRAPGDIARHAGAAIVALGTPMNGPPNRLPRCLFAGIVLVVRRNELQTIAVGQQFERLFGRDEAGLERHSHSINVGLPQPRAQRGTAEFGHQVIAPRHAALRALAKAMFRDLIQRRTASVGAMGGRSL